MPAVNVTYTKYNVAGSLRDQIYQITGVSNDFLVVGLNTVGTVVVQPGSPINGIALAPGPFPGSTQITFTSTGIFTNSRIEVKGN